MKFRTEYIAASREPLDVERPVVLAGSCFAENIYNKMSQCMWPAIHGMGTLYNPLSIADALEISVRYDIDAFRHSLFQDGGIFHSWLFDSKMSAGSREACEEKFCTMAGAVRSSLAMGETLIVTFGTAWCYYHGGRLVANCHKQPTDWFERRRLDVDEIAGIWSELIGNLRQHYPGLRIIFTVSPVRHLKDGFAGNAQSKATLLLAVERICSQNPGCEYFPAYEIVNDDLRDYRWYADDLAHPSAGAVEYIWEKFQDTYVTAAGRERLRQGLAMTRRAAHRPIIS